MTYTSETKIEAELQFTINGTTKPTTDQVDVWITEEEAIIDEKGLGTLTASNALIDVPEEREAELPPVGSLRWFEHIAHDWREKYLRAGRVVIPELKPIIAVTSLSRRTSGLGATEAWEALTEGLAEDYIILKARTKAGLRGWGFYFFDNLPASGYQRIKATYTYGLGLPDNILSPYATWKVALRVLMALAQTSNPSSLTQFVGGDLQTYVPTQYKAKWDELIRKIEKWELDWISPPIAVGVL